MAASGLRVGVVGLGERAHSLTRRGEIHSDHQVLGVDADQSARQRFEAEFGCDTFESFEGLYDEAMDAIVVTTPTRFHESVVVPALERDIPVYVEKPLAHDLASARRIAEAAEDSEAICMVAFFAQAFSEVKILKSYIESGRLGPIEYCEGKQVLRRNVPRRGSWYTSERLAGGGALVDRGSYDLDVLLYLLDYPAVSRVVGKTWTSFGDREDYAFLDMWGSESEDNMFDVEDSAVAFIEFENGCVVSIQTAWAANVQENSHVVRLYGDDIGASLEFVGRGTNTYEEARLTMSETRKDVVDHHVNSDLILPDNRIQKQHVDLFFEAVETGDPPEHGTVEQALAVQRILKQIYES